MQYRIIPVTPFQQNCSLGWCEDTLDAALIEYNGKPVDNCRGAFEQVVEACADPGREGAWITPEIAAAYQELHRLGWAHSVEVWRDHELVGGLYGLAVGRLFAAESKFHRATDASKVALVRLVQVLSEDEEPWAVDVQWSTPHLARLGVREVGRPAYLDLVRALRSRPLPTRWRAGPT